MRRIFLLCVAVLLSACGGGGGSGSAANPPPPPSNNPPVAQAGSIQTVVEQTTVILDGTGSTDSDGTIVAYEWTQLSGTTVVINNATQAQANFTAPVVANDTDLVFQLLVTDDDSATRTDTITITVQPAIFNLSGTITAPAGTAVDGDVNDPNAQSIPNNTPITAQTIPNPITVGGYVNVAGAGEIGPLQASGDISDYYRVNLIAGETITLFVADPTIGDPDLYLWDAAGVNILDFSINVDAVESLIVPSNGEFLVEAFAFSGASNYVLIIGQTLTAGASGGFRLSDNFVPGEIIMRYSSSVSLTAQQSAAQPFMSSLGLQKLGGAPNRAMLLALNGQSNRSKILQTQDDDLSAVDRMAALASDEQRLKFETLMVIKALNREPSVKYAQPNYIAKTMAIPNDQWYSLQWHYPLINLPAAWDITTGDPSVTIAVIDTGVLLNHPDIQGQLVTGYDFVSNIQTAADGDGIDPNPDDPGDGGGQVPSSFHGTHVAGTIAAATNNGIGVAGVAGNAKIMPIRVLGVGGGSFFDIIQGVRYAAGFANDSGQVANPPVDVMNLSLGGLVPCGSAEQDVFALVRQAGVVVVVAAGNDNQDAANFSPASCDNVITVSAVDIAKNKASYSNFGTIIDVAAPGGDNSTDLNGDGYADGVLSPSADDSSGSIAFTYFFLSGTSMASPHVAGVVALMKSVNPNLTPSQIDQMLVNGELTDDIGDPSFFGNGLINARKAVFAALNAVGAPPADNPTLVVTPQSLNFGATSTRVDFTAQNTGGGILQVNAWSWSAPWLNLFSVDLTPENLGTYAVIIDRTGLADGVYSDTITLQSNVNTVQVFVIMQVSTAVIEPDAGFLYVLLIDKDTGDVVRQFNVAASGGEYAYQFVDVPDGSYIILAGTDSDNDFFICDSGEACGAFLTSDQPQVISVNQNLTNLDFPVGHITAIPTQSLNAETEAPRGYRRLVEPTYKQLDR